MHSLENSKVSDTTTCDEFNAKKPKENTYLNFIRKGNLNRLVLAHININSIRSKFKILKEKVDNKSDVFFIVNTFPPRQLILEGFNSPNRLNGTLF